MSGCDGCLTSGKGQNEHLINTREQARKYAQQHDQTVAIYKEAQEYRFTEYGYALHQGFQIIELVSKHSGAALPDFF